MIQVNATVSYRTGWRYSGSRSLFCAQERLDLFSKGLKIHVLIKFVMKNAGLCTQLVCSFAYMQNTIRVHHVRLSACLSLLACSFSSITELF